MIVTAIISDFNIIRTGGDVTARMELATEHGTLGFGGSNLFTGRNYLGHFIFRCMEIASVVKIMEMAGVEILAEIEDDLVTGIGNNSGFWFHPAHEFFEV